MCGIAGILGGGLHAAAQVEKMIGSLVHRGPDGSRVCCYPGGVLGHCRLSVIDLSERAAQPMSTADGRHAIVFNGEIYNYLELRRELAGDYSFCSDSDTEVLLAAWRRWGADCLHRLNGMYAFCIYDTEEQTAFFARDRFGQKPLFFAVESEGGLLFASEVKALLAAGVIARPNLEVWGRYLTTASYDDTVDTFFAGVSQLMPGECATYSSVAGLKRCFYYRLSEHYSPQFFSEDEAAEQVRHLMVDACRIHMRSDVPVGIMLSGGLDSSTLLASFDLAGVLHSGVKCFSVDFGPDFTERPWIEAAAGHHDLSSCIESFSPEDFKDSLGSMMWDQEAPIGGLMNCALSAVMRVAQQQGVVVLQAGAGPDEIFGGYRNHHNLYLGLLLHSGAIDAEQRVAEYARNWGVDLNAARQAAQWELSRPVTAIDGTIPVKPEALSRSVTGGPCAAAGELGIVGHPLRDSQLHYLQGSKIPRNTRMLDRLSMSHGIEVRLPFLDHRLVELGFGLPSHLYFLEGRSKGIVRSAFQGAMNDDVRLATKRSIQAPQGMWLRSEPMATYIERLINSESFASRNLFDVPACKALFARFMAGEFENSFFVWQWINAEEWFRTFIDGSRCTV